MIKTFAVAMIAAVFAFHPALAQPTAKPRPEVITHGGFGFSSQAKQKEGEKGPNLNPIVVYDVLSAWQAKPGHRPARADCGKFKTQLSGVTWCFRSAANLKRFIAKTDKDGDNPYIPFVGGRCTLGFAWGRIDAVGDPLSARVVRGRRGPILVLHSAEKWWPEFNKNRAVDIATTTALYSILRETGHIVPNDKM